MGKRKKPKNKDNRQTPTTSKEENLPKKTLRKTQKLQKGKAKKKKQAFAKFLEKCDSSDPSRKHGTKSTAKSGPSTTSTKSKALQSWKAVIDTAQDVAIVDLKPGSCLVDFAHVGKKTKKQKALEKKKAQALARKAPGFLSFKTSELPVNVVSRKVFDGSTEDESSADTGNSSDDVCIVHMDGSQAGTSKQISQNGARDPSWLTQFKIPKRPKDVKKSASSSPRNQQEKPSTSSSPSISYRQVPNSHQEQQRRSKRFQDAPSPSPPNKNRKPSSIDSPSTSQQQTPKRSFRHPSVSPLTRVQMEESAAMSSGASICTNKRFQDAPSPSPPNKNRKPSSTDSPSTSQQQTPKRSFRHPSVSPLTRVQMEESAAMSSGASSGRSELESDFSEMEFGEMWDEVEASPVLVGQTMKSTPPEATYAKARARILPNTLPTHCVAIIHPLSLLPFYGQVKMTVISGEVKVHGYITSADSQPVVLYSPKCAPALCLETSDKIFTFESDRTVPRSVLKEKLENVFLTDFAETMMEEVVREVMKHGASVVVLEPHWSDRVDYITSFPAYEDLFEQAVQKLSKSKTQQKIMSEASDMGFVPVRPDRNVKLLTAPPVYHTVSETVLQSFSQSGPGRPPIIVVCGSKNVGKSTLARYLVNSMLNKTDAVCYLDCDVGQTEFTPSTMLGITKVTEPLLGPPFTHDVKPEKMCFFGETSPSSSPALYFRLLRSLFKYYMDYLQDCPLVINCMGWMKGLGLCLLVDTIRLTEPSHIIQLLPTPKPKHYPILDKNYLQHARGWSRKGSKGPLYRGPWELNHMLIQMPWAAEEGRKYKAANLRELALLGYLSQLMPPKLKFHDPLATFDPLPALEPYIVPWKSVAVHVCNTEVPPSQLMYSLNASIVGLCKANPRQMVSLESDESDNLPKVFHSTPVCECLGLGLIRGIDPVDRKFYILTHLPEMILREVNTLLKGSLTLPQFVLLQGQRTGVVPYVTSEFPHDVTGTGAIKVRHIVPKYHKK